MIRQRKSYQHYFLQYTTKKQDPRVSIENCYTSTCRYTSRLLGEKVLPNHHCPCWSFYIFQIPAQFVRIVVAVEFAYMCIPQSYNKIYSANGVAVSFCPFYQAFSRSRYTQRKDIFLSFFLSFSNIGIICSQLPLEIMWLYAWASYIQGSLTSTVKLSMSIMEAVPSVIKNMRLLTVNSKITCHNSLKLRNSFSLNIPVSIYLYLSIDIKMYICIHELDSIRSVSLLNISQYDIFFAYRFWLFMKLLLRFIATVNENLEKQDRDF